MTASLRERDVFFLFGCVQVGTRFSLCSVVSSMHLLTAGAVSRGHLQFLDDTFKYDDGDADEFDGWGYDFFERSLGYTLRQRPWLGTEEEPEWGQR